MWAVHGRSSQRNHLRLVPIGRHGAVYAVAERERCTLFVHWGRSPVGGQQNRVELSGDPREWRGSESLTGCDLLINLQYKIEGVSNEYS